MFCEKCGAQVPDDSAFCPVCGNSVVPQQGAAAGNTGYVNMGAAAQGNAGPAGPVYGYQGGAYPGAAPVKKKKSSLPIILGIVAVVAVAAVAGVLFLGKPYMKPIDKFCKAYNDSSIEVMHDAVADVYYYDADFESIIDEYYGVTYTVTNVEHPTGEDLSYYKSMYGIKDCYIISTDMSYYSMTFGEESSEYIFTVGKANGKWKIYDIY
ncbi:MAG: zinc ribbon domain-containing protein [Mogibacterium sp.]|nr:zinc ribbon domain-containing protein [Mogibacterium sp.]